MRLIIFCLAILAAFTACKKEKQDNSSFWNCNQSQNLDSTAISAKLIGSWTWSKQSCFWTGKTVVANKNIKVTFKSDHTLSVSENATSLTQGTWNLTPLFSSSWALNLSLASEYLYGYIMFCDNQVLFNDSYRDGCDNLFNKSN